MEIAFDFGITNTDVAVQDKQKLTFYTFSSKKVEIAFISEILSEINLDKKLITKIVVTGGKSGDLQDALHDIPIIKINEVEAIGHGAKEVYQIKDNKFMTVSTGTGTACVAYMNEEFHHLGGISVGGGTLQGLSNLTIDINKANEIEELSKVGNKKNLDALIGEVVNKIGSLNTDITASNFSKARNKTDFNNEDIASSLSNMVGEVIGTVSYLNALLMGVSNVYFVGRVSKMGSVKNGIEKRLNLAGICGNYIEKQEFANVIGAIAYLNANT
jgi:type II pantothenate kinase